MDLSTVMSVVLSDDWATFFDKHTGDLIQFAGFLATAAAIVISHSKDRDMTERSNYQQLELASIDLFRFESDHPSEVERVWRDSDRPDNGTAAFVSTNNYVCQMLNLFEMAIEFRQTGSFEPELFGTWVMWFYNLSTAPGFPYYWENSRPHYTPIARAIMNEGVRLAGAIDKDDERMRKFYAFVGSKACLDCHVILEWCEQVASETLPPVTTSATAAGAAE